MSNNCFVLLFCVFAALPAFSAQHVTVHPRPGFDSAEQDVIRQIVDMERQAKEASLRRDGGSGCAKQHLSLCALL